MAPIIQVSPDLLRGKATEVRNYKSQHEEVITKLTTLVNGLNEIWKGDSQTSFNNNFQEMLPTFREFAELLENYAKKMDNAAKLIEDADQQAK